MRIEPWGVKRSDHILDIPECEEHADKRQQQPRRNIDLVNVEHWDCSLSAYLCGQGNMSGSEDCRSGDHYLSLFSTVSLYYRSFVRRGWVVGAAVRRW
jgi:hypothetical protein